MNTSGTRSDQAAKGPSASKGPRTSVRSWYRSAAQETRIWAREAATIARKELATYFGSPMALIFVGTFLVVTLFTFFWVETFWVRNIADVRPLFRWMPALMVFLVAALTMRQWSDEQRGGTLEILLTLPVRRASLVLGKFLAVMALIALALGLTLFVPLTVDMLGDLDWGPVVGGYLAALLMASAYVAIGLAVSARTDNQIVALIVTILICGVLYLVGTQSLTALVGDAPAEILRAIGTGSRFESIERGVIDLRDLVYYLSLTTLFLVLNILTLDMMRWSRTADQAEVVVYRRNAVLRVALVAANLLAANVWLFPIRTLRVDLTAQREYSLSTATRDLIANLQEPLLMRGYFSAKTHPLLAPLVPAIRDMMQEYAAASGKIEVEIVDPRDDADLEAEANQVYGIRPVPFRISGRYEDSIINSYFDVLIRYGDQSMVLGFQDLIEVEPLASGQVDVRLRNLEYDLTRSIKKVVYGFQSLDMLLASLDVPVQLTALVTERTLPASLQDVVGLIDTVGQTLVQESGGKLSFRRVDPDLDAAWGRQALYDQWKIQPFAVSLFAPDTYYLHLLLQVGDQADVLYPGGNASEADLRAEIEASLKRSAPGFLKKVGVWNPSEDPVASPYGGTMQPISTWQSARTQLAQSYTIEAVDLTTGRVPGDVDVLVVIAPQNMGELERFALDQYLMRGGALIVAAGSYVLSPEQYGGGIVMDPVQNGLQDLLAHYGVAVSDKMVLDPRNEPFPIQVQRQVGTMSVLELQQLDYPYFVDVRRDSMAGDSPIVSNLPAVTLQWASPIEVDEERNRDRQVTVLLRSSEEAWTSSSADVNPDTTTYPEQGFPIEGERQAWPLAVSVRGSFDSYYQDRPSPFESNEPASVEAGTPALGTIDTSPDSARLVVIGSAEFLDDAVLDISRSISSERYLNNLQLLQNAVDWAVEDEDLLTIRARGLYARLLEPMDQKQQSFWEGLNYAVALIGLVAIGVVWNLRRRSEEPMALVDGVDADTTWGGGDA